MIHHYFTRTFDDCRGKQVCADRQMTIHDALRYIIRAELGYGSKVNVINPQRVETSSGCMGSIDNMIFSGSVSDMAAVIELCNTYTGFCTFKPGSRFPSNVAGIEFANKATEFLSDMYAGKSALSVTLNALVLARAPEANLSKLNQVEVLDLYLSLVDGSFKAEEVNELFA